MQIINIFRKVIFCSLILVGIHELGTAQMLGSQLSVEFRDFSGNEIPLALVGGLDNPQFSEADLNQDGIMDLVVFDKTGGAIVTLLNEGTAGQVDYTYRPDLAKQFPPIEEWMLMRDYNGDGIADIFASGTRQASAAIEVYKGKIENGLLAFELLSNPGFSFDVLTFPNNSGTYLNIYVTGQDIPAIDDIDGDGDLDIVTFAFSGGSVEYYQNQSVEMGYGLDSLIFEFEDKCWGRFYESGFGSTIELSTSIDTCAGTLEPVDGFWEGETSGTSSRHAGSTVLTLDLDGDNDKEVVLGDVSFSNFSMLTNTGDNMEAYMTLKDQSFPNYDTPLELELFPAGFYLDVDNDGKKDLIAAPNVEGISANYDVAWYYKNVSVDENIVFELQQKDLLVDDMVDFGSGANPTFVDYNADGLMDLLVGSFGLRLVDGTYDARLFLFENIGTASSPVFQLKDEDYLGLSTLDTRNFVPDFGDLDGDGDLDLIVGEEFGKLIYFENTAGVDVPFDFAEPIISYAAIDVGQFSAPRIWDVDDDGLADLIIGERNGNVNFFKNTGSLGEPNFDFTVETPPNNPLWGGIDTRLENFVTGFSNPVIVEVEEELKLFSGSESGGIHYYDSIAYHLDGDFPLKSVDYSSVKEGKVTVPAFYDINSDGFIDMLVGNRRGGFSIYQTDLPSGLTPIVRPELQKLEAAVYPNPSNGSVVVSTPGDSRIEYDLRLFDTIGRMVFFSNINGGKESLEMKGLNDGLYFLEIKGQEGVFNTKLIVKN